MRTYILCGLIFLVYGCQNQPDSDFASAQYLLEHFETILTPKEYAKTYYYHVSQDSLWMDENNKPATIDIPYRNHFFGFGPNYAASQQGGTGVNSKLIKRYKAGRLYQRIYELEKLKFENKPRNNPIYVLWINPTQKVEKARLYSAEGVVLKESKADFLGGE